MFESNISADLTQLDELSKRIKKEAEETEVIKDRLIAALNRIRCADFPETEFQLRKCINKAEELCAELSFRASALEKSIDIYCRTETEQLLKVEQLPDFNMKENGRTSLTAADGNHAPYIDNKKVFSSCYIVNEDWLGEAVSEWNP